MGKFVFEMEKEVCSIDSRNINSTMAQRTLETIDYNVASKELIFFERKFGSLTTEGEKVGETKFSFALKFI